MNKEWYSASQIAGLSGVPSTERGIRKAAERESWDSKKKDKGKGFEYHITSLPIETQVELTKQFIESQPVPSINVLEATSNIFTYDREALWENYDSKTDKKKSKAQDKLNAILTALELISNGVSATNAWNQAAKAHNVNRSTLYGWYNGRKHAGHFSHGVKDYERSDWLASLVPHHVGKAFTAEFTEEAWEVFKADYLRLEQPELAACYNRLIRSAEEHNWVIPCMRTVERKVKNDIPLTTRVFLREGEHALSSLYPALQRSVANLHALEWINGDGYYHNIFVLWPDGTINRPKTWFWQDIYSRYILSHRTDQSENTDMLRLSFGDLVELYGIPDDATIDNTRAAANKWMTGGVKNRYRFKVKEDDPLGIMPTLGVKVHWTSVNYGHGHGQAKPVERAFGVGGLGEYVDKHPAFAGAYTGNNPNAKPENYASKAIPLETFLKVLHEEIIAWNQRDGRRTEACEGKYSFEHVFKKSYEQSTIRKATVEQRRLWLLAAEAIKVAKDGSVTLDAGKASGIGKNRYHSDSLYDHVGQKVVVRFDPDNLHSEVHVYTLDGSYIAAASCFEAAGFGDTKAARSHNRARREMVKAHKTIAKAETRMDALEAAEFLPQSEASPLPNAGAVQMLKPKVSQSRAPKQRELTEQEQALHDELMKGGSELNNIQQLPETQRQRYMRWAEMDQALKQGAEFNEDEMNWYVSYQKTVEFKAEHDLAIEFGLVAQAE